MVDLSIWDGRRDMELRIVELILLSYNHLL